MLRVSLHSGLVPWPGAHASSALSTAMQIVPCRAPFIHVLSSPRLLPSAQVGSCTRMASSVRCVLRIMSPSTMWSCTAAGLRVGFPWVASSSAAHKRRTLFTWMLPQAMSCAGAVLHGTESPRLCPTACVQLPVQRCKPWPSLCSAPYLQPFALPACMHIVHMVVNCTESRWLAPFVITCITVSSNCVFAAGDSSKLYVANIQACESCLCAAKLA